MEELTWKYVRDGKRLNIYGSDGVRDIQTIKKFIQEGKITDEINVIFYQKNHDSAVGMLFRGRYLENLLKADEPQPGRPSFRSILKQINDTNTRQTAYSGVLIYATNTKRFLFLMPKHRKGLWGLLGDNPKDGEPPPDTVVRVAKDDCHFEVTANCLVPLIPIEIDGTTYYNYLILSNHEFKPNLSNQFIGSTWRSYEAMEELALYPSVLLLFEKDTKLHKLITPITEDFENLIEDILHSPD